MLGGRRDSDRPADDGVQDRPRPDEDRQAQQGRVRPGNGSDADADVAGHLEDRKGAGETTKRRRRDQVQRARVTNAKPANAANNASVQSTDTSATPATIPTPPVTASLHGVDADITDRPQEREPVTVSSTLVLARTA